MITQLDSHHLAHLYTILLWWLALSQILSFWIVLRVNSILGDSQEQNLTSFNIPKAWLAPGKPKKYYLENRLDILESLVWLRALRAVEL